MVMPGLALPASGPQEFNPISSVVRPGDDWEAVRKQYDLWSDRIYLNTGGLGPSPRPVLDRSRQVSDDLQHRSESGHALIEAAREPVARFLGAASTEIAFTRNATEGNAIIAAGLQLVHGDEIIIDSHAHPGGAIPWLNRWKQDGVVIRTFDPSGTDAHGILARIEALLSPRTRAIQVSHITAPTGILLPVKDIAALARHHGCWFHIDGAQSAGMTPVDLHEIGCHSWATSGHKWLGAPHGTGILFIREEHLDRIRPTEIGAYSDQGYALPDQLTYVPTARRHESGTRSASLVEGVHAACTYMGALGMDRVRARGLSLTDRLASGLSGVAGVELLSPEAPELCGSIFSFRMPDIPFRQAYARLSQEHRMRIRIVTEAGLNAIRISLHVFNNEDDVDRVVAGVRAIRRG